MKVCASFGDSKFYSPKVFGEVRLDVFEKLPSEFNECSILTLCGKSSDFIPKEYNGFVDAGYDNLKTKNKTIVSYHDFEKTPSVKNIEKIMTKYPCDISKGAFYVKNFKDLNKIYSASKSIGKKHVIIGMGELGQVTRIRQRLLKNEFTYGFVGKPTAEGQLSCEILDKLGDDCKIVGLVGNPIEHSLSPEIQNSAIKKEKINGIYLKFQSPDIDEIDAVMKEYDILGLNVTSPFKEKILKKLDSLSDLAEELNAVNTIANEKGKLKGYNTDVAGVEYALRGHDAKGKTALVMGTGGTAKAAIIALKNRGCSVSVAGRNPKKVKQISKIFGTEINFDATDKYEILINCTPIGIVTGKYPTEIVPTEKQLVIDSVYGKTTPLLKISKGEKEDGKKMLVGQGAESFRIWFGKRTCRKSMLRAIS